MQWQWISASVEIVSDDKEEEREKPFQLSLATNLLIYYFSSNYPEKRSRPGPDGCDVGVPGTLTMLKATTLSQQPVNSFDWNVDMEGLAVCGAFDQTIRVLITTRLNLQ